MAPAAPIDPDGPGLESSSRFAALAEELLEEHDETKVLSQICERAMDFVPGVDFCGITLRGPRRRLESACATDERAEASDALQRDLGEGPCMEAAHDVKQLYVVHDVRTDERWPRWGPRAGELGIRGMVSVKLSSETISEEHAPLGALNMYSGEIGWFGPGIVEVARIYAVHCANAVAQARQIGGLQRAVESRHQIGVAQGILMQRYGLDVDTAFDVLQRYSTTTNTKLRDVASRVVEHGGLPDQAAPASG
jgi:hypothetical protein